jgi:hypothetical protein
MRNKSFATLGSFMLLAAACAYGQTVHGKELKLDIPFEFQVGETVLPAGQYQVTLSASNGRLSLDCLTCQGHVLTTTTGGRGDNEAPTSGLLMFNKYGDKWFLSTVRLPDQAEGRALPESKIEREIARITPPAQTTQVLLALR